MGKADRKIFKYIGNKTLYCFLSLYIIIMFKRINIY